MTAAIPSVKGQSLGRPGLQLLNAGDAEAQRYAEDCIQAGKRAPLAGCL